MEKILPLLIAFGVGGLVTTALVLRNNVSSFDQVKEKAKVRKLIEAHKDFPKKGIVFQDIFPILRSPGASKSLLHLLVAEARKFGKIDAIVGLDSRGFLYGPAMAIELNCSFVPVRKSGKLPGQVITVSYGKEYGDDSFDIQKNSIPAGSNVLIFDDLLATGGSLFGACHLVEKMNSTVVCCLVIIELAELKGRDKVKKVVTSLYQY